MQVERMGMNLYRQQVVVAIPSVCVPVVRYVFSVFEFLVVRTIFALQMSGEE